VLCNICPYRTFALKQLWKSTFLQLPWISSPWYLKMAGVFLTQARCSVNRSAVKYTCSNCALKLVMAWNSGILIRKHLNIASIRFVHYYIKHKRPCLTTFPNTEKRVQNTMLSRVVFFWWTSRCFEMWSIMVSHVWCILS